MGCDSKRNIFRGERTENVMRLFSQGLDLAPLSVASPGPPPRLESG